MGIFGCYDGLFSWLFALGLGLWGKSPVEGVVHRAFGCDMGGMVLGVFCHQGYHFF